MIITTSNECLLLFVNDRLIIVDWLQIDILNNIYRIILLMRRDGSQGRDIDLRLHYYSCIVVEILSRPYVTSIQLIILLILKFLHVGHLFEIYKGV